MSLNTDYSVRRVNTPKGGRYGRRLGWRDRVMGIGFIVLLLFGLWWVLMRPSPYIVLREDLSGVLYYTDSNNTATHHEFFGRYGQGDVVVIVGIGNEFVATTDRAVSLLNEMVVSGEYPDADLKRFSNAVVVCGVPEACSSLARRVADNSRAREAQVRTDAYR